jgi:nitrous oxidase accessory protein NosD
MKRGLGVLSFFALVIAILVCSAGIASAVNIDVSAGGDLQAALNTAPSGATIRLAEGTYAGEGFVVLNSITIEGGWNADFTERDYENYPTVILGTSWGIRGYPMDLGWWAVDGVTVIGTGTGIGIENCCDDLTVRNCTVLNFDTGVFFCGTIVNTLENTTVANNNLGVYLCTAAANIYKCEIVNNAEGIYNCCGEPGRRIVSTTFVGNDIAVTGCGHWCPVISNSIVWGNLEAFDYDATYMLANGLIHNSIIDDPAYDGQAGNSSADPLFTDAANGDYTLQSGSPAIDAGVETMLNYGPPDLNEAPLAFNGPAPDLGANETEYIIPAEVDVQHDIINVNNNGNNISAVIELPDGNAGDIVIGSVLLNDTVVADTFSELGDDDSDGIADLKVRFDRQAVHAILTVDGPTTLTITGTISDGTKFEGSDVVTVTGNSP